MMFNFGIEQRPYDPILCCDGEEVGRPRKNQG